MILIVIVYWSWITSLYFCIAEDKNADKSDARTGSFKSHPEDDSYDYGDENYKRHKTKIDYLPVFVPEEVKKKSRDLFFSIQHSKIVPFCFLRNSA